MNSSTYQNYKTQNSLQNDLAFEQQKQQQIQKLNTKQSEEVQLIRYYIYENLQFFINLISSLKAVNEHFKNDPQHPMRIIARNKIVLQSNLSNSINYDQAFQYQSDYKLNQVLQLEKQNAKQLLEKLSPELEEFHNYFETYKTNSLNQNIQICQQKLEQTNLDEKFDQNVLQKVINQIQLVDQTAQQFKEQKIYNRPNIEDIVVKAKNYYEKTKQQLEINFPNPTKIEWESQIINQQQDAQVSSSKMQNDIHVTSNQQIPENHNLSVQTQKSVGIIKRKIYKDNQNKNINYSHHQHKGKR